MPLSSWKERHTPKLIICLREGYGTRTFLSDLAGGLTVAVIALPLAMALGIASIPQEVANQLAALAPWLTPPAMGLSRASRSKTATTTWALLLSATRRLA